MLVIVDNNIDKLNHDVNAEIKTIEKWMHNNNKLTINYSKSEYVIITNLTHAHKFKLKVYGIYLNEVNYFKYFMGSTLIINYLGKNMLLIYVQK